MEQNYSWNEDTFTCIGYNSVFKSRHQIFYTEQDRLCAAFIRDVKLAPDVNSDLLPETSHSLQRFSGWLTDELRVQSTHAHDYPTILQDYPSVFNIPWRLPVKTPHRIFKSHACVQLRWTINLKTFVPGFYGPIGACACRGYQALDLPRGEGPGDEARPFAWRLSSHCDNRRKSIRFQARLLSSVSDLALSSVAHAQL